MASQIDQDSLTWLAVKDWAEKRITQHQRVLETAGLPQDQTENSRGAICDLRALLRLPEQAVIRIQDSE